MGIRWRFIKTTNERKIHDLFFNVRVHLHNDFIEQIVSRQYIIAYLDLVEAIHMLYRDALSKHPKRGTQSRRSLGNFRALVTIIVQPKWTCDIYSMDGGKILKLLLPEFDDWRKNG